MRLCALAGVTKQAYYKRDADVHFRRLAVEGFVAEFAREQRESDPMIGCDKLWRMYCRQSGAEARVGRDAFRRILRENGLALEARGHRPRTTDSRHGMPTYPNLVKDIIPTRPNQIWVSDITYIALHDPAGQEEGRNFCYLSLVQDAYSKMILGWRVAPTLHGIHSLMALRDAVGSLPEGFADPLTHHSDRGVQYACADYISELAGNGITPSMTEDGNPKDNAVAERVNSTIKNEMLHGKELRDVGQAREAVAAAVDFYNNRRPHLSLGWHTPAEAHRMTGEQKRLWRSGREEAIKKRQETGAS